MEETFTNTPQPAAEQPKGIILLHDAQAYLVTAGKWARFLGILGFISTGLLVLVALFIGTIMATFAGLSSMGRAGVFPAGLMSFYYLLIAVFYFFMSLFLYQFGTRVKNGVAFNNSVEVTSGLGKLKSLLKMVGIITIVAIVLALLAAIGVAIFVSHMSHGATPEFGS